MNHEQTMKGFAADQYNFETIDWWAGTISIDWDERLYGSCIRGMAILVYRHHS